MQPREIPRGNTLNNPNNPPFLQELEDLSEVSMRTYIGDLMRSFLANNARSTGTDFGEVKGDFMQS